MSVFVLDADGAIKLAKARALETLASAATCFLPLAVYEEISKGKEKMYEDAFDIESLVSSKKIKLIKINIERINEGLGAGECSALAAYTEVNADAIISDDRKFLAFLERQNIPFITPTDAIVFLVIKKRITKQKGILALEQIRHLVREENYLAAKKEIGGE